MTSKDKTKPETVESTKAVAADVKAVIHAGNEAVVEGLGQAVEITKQQADKAGALATKNLEDLSQAGQTTVDTWMTSGNILIKGVEEASRAMIQFAQVAFDTNLEMARRVVTSASVTEAWDIQTNHVKASFDSLLAESNKVSAITKSALQQAAAPFERQLKDGFGRLLNPPAA